MTMPGTRRHNPLDPLTLPLHGSTLIEASAGTGKTFTIAILYVRLVLGHGQPQGSPLASGLLPPNLLVVTFTDAATKELRDRIRNRLTQAAEVFSETADPARATGETALLFRLRDTDYPDPASWPACRRQLLLAAEWMDEAAVSTIHAWCNRMLSEHAFDSGSLFRLTLETDQTPLLEDAVRDYWRTFIYPLTDRHMEDILRHWKTPEDLLQSVRRLIPEAESLARPDGDVKAILDQVVQQKQAQSAELKSLPWGDWKDQVADLLNNLHKDKRLHGGSKKSMLATWDALTDWSVSDALLPEGLDKAGFRNQTPEGLAAILKGEGQVPEHPAFEAIARIMAFADQLPDAGPDILRHASVWIARRLESEKQKQSQMGFDDLLTRLDQALHGPRGDQLAATIRRQFPVALIDEFQDTDPVQYRIFNRVYRVADNDPDTCMLMIGDPKQAIYGFRGADIHTYLEARKGARERTYTLSRNYRSADTMVQAVNRVFEQADNHSSDGAFLFGRGDQSPLPFQPVDAQGTGRFWAVDGTPRPSLTFWALEPEEGGKALAKGTATDTLAQACASEITRLLTLGQQGRAGFAASAGEDDLQALTPGDIAILVNNRTEAAAVRTALAQRRIRSVYLSDRDSVLHSPAAAEVLCWLRAFAEPQQLALARAALATPTLGLSWHYLDQLLTDEIAMEREIERFMGYRQQWQSRGVLPMLHRFLMDFDVPARLLQRPDGERALTDILHIAELLQQDSLQLDGEHALVHHFAQTLSSADEENEHRTLRLESDEGLVKVITVHKSKGLEYPLVFLPFGTAFRKVSEKDAWVRYHDDSGKLVTLFEPGKEDFARADRERLGEDIRKLYVALTRARFATWVGVAAIDNWQLSGLGYLMAGTGDATPGLAEALAQLAGDQPGIAITQVPEASDSVWSEPEPEALGPALVSTRAPREDWWIASYSAIEYTGMAGTGIGFDGDLEDAEAQNLVEESAQEPEGEMPAPVSTRDHHHFPRGAGPGTFLHELLEWCARQGFATLAGEPELLRSYLQRLCSVRGWSDWTQTLEHWVLGLIRQPLALERDSNDRVSLAQLDSYRPELEFWFESREVATETLDRLVRQHTLGQADRPRAVPGHFNGMLKGFIDLVFEHKGRYYVLDYKSNALGEDDSAYTDQSMGEAILDKRYDLQYVLYLLALHRLLKTRLPDYDYDRHIGGAVYLFLRGYRSAGAGAFTDKPSRELMEQLDALFRGRNPSGEEAA